LLAAVPQNNHMVALHECGGARCRKELAAQIGYWLHAGCDIALIIGGPDGLAHAEEQWSLSRVILWHTLVRVIVAEQLYWALTIIRGHPYHQAWRA
jgi:23S rRNA (pseudouridine1915-N3)-methyltransferase